MSDKAFLTYEEQIDLLRKKNLTINDVDEAIRILKKESYFSLINGYKGSFKREDNRKIYKDGATFSDIYALYKFDEELRIVFLKYIMVVERCIKSLISYEFCSEHGELQCEYFNANNYRYDTDNVENINKFLSSLSNIYHYSKSHDYIQHYCDTYKNVPLWVLMNALTFGQTSQMYQYLPDRIQAAIGKHFPVMRNTVESMLRLITFFRNVCAHNERLFNFTVSKKSAPRTYVHTYMNCGANEGKNDLFAVVICFKYLLDDEDFNLFASELQGVLARYKGGAGILPLEKLLKQMGFPPRWRRILNAPLQEPPNVYKKRLDSARIK